MSSSAGSSGTQRFLRIARIVGYFVFLAAFFLPAVREPGHDDVLRGSMCAWITIINTFNREVWRTKDCLATLSGWINPLMLVYVASLFSRKLLLLRRMVAVVIALLLVGTWVYFYLAPLVPLVGHFCWVVGIAMILAGEMAPRNEAHLPAS